MSDWIMYYNPKCGTCRNALALLESKGVKPKLIEYLKTPPTEKDLDEILKKLGLEPIHLARKKEPIYSQLKLDERKLTRAEWLKIFAEHPILIERPVVVKGSRAIIARPFEKAAELL